MHKFKILSMVSLAVVFIIVLILYLQPRPSIIEKRPVLEYSQEPVPDFSSYTQIKEKKKAFFQYLRPAVEAQNEYILQVRQYIQGLYAKHKMSEPLSEEQAKELAWLREEYRVDDKLEQSQVFEALLTKLDLIPPELVLVQAANESAWGTSRFAKEGYNFFGIWCFKKGCGFVPNRRNEGAVHEVAKFEDLSKAMYIYMRNLNRHPAYKELRLIRKQYRTNQKPIKAYSLIEGLHKYSERGEEYVEELRQMIRVNMELMNS